MARMLQARLANEPQLRYMTLERNGLDLTDPTHGFDGMHLTSRGNEQFAERLVGPVLEALGVVDETRTAA